jgi:hypothetical protein
MLHDPQTCQKYRLDYVFAESRRRALWLRQQRRRENGNIYRLGSQNLEKARPHALKACKQRLPREKPAANRAGEDKLMTVNAVQGRQR